MCLDWLVRRDPFFWKTPKDINKKTPNDKSATQNENENSCCGEIWGKIRKICCGCGCFDETNKIRGDCATGRWYLRLEPREVKDIRATTSKYADKISRKAQRDKDSRVLRGMEESVNRVHQRLEHIENKQNAEFLLKLGNIAEIANGLDRTVKEIAKAVASLKMNTTTNAGKNRHSAPNL